MGIALAMSHPLGIAVKALDRKVRILIADGHPVIRKRVRSTLEEHSRFEVCAEVEDGVQAIEETQRLKPDVVVLNVTMPVLDGFQAAREIKASQYGRVVTVRPTSVISAEYLPFELINFPISVSSTNPSI